MKKILIIEDDELLRENIAEFLNEENFSVVVAENGVEGIQQAIEHTPKLILCDIEMPKLRGYDVYRILQENPETQLIPFVFLTAKVSKDDIRAGMQLGVDDYITKPFDFDELLTTINTRISKREKFLNANKENHQVLFENPHTGIMIFKNRRIVYANAKLTKLTGYSIDELLRLNVLDVIAQDDKGNLLKKTRQCMRGIQKNFNFSFSIIHKEMKVIRLKMNAGLTRHEGKKALIGNIVEDNKNSGDPNIFVGKVSEEEIEKAVKFITSNKTMMTKKMVDKLAELYDKESNTNEFTNPDKLSKREVETLKLICDGMTTQQIANKLFLSSRTIDTHRANLISKTGSKNIVELVIYAIRNKIASIN